MKPCQKRRPCTSWLCFFELSFASACHAEQLLKEAAVRICKYANRGLCLLVRPYLMPTVTSCCCGLAAGIVAIAARNRLIRVNIFRISCSSLALASWEFNSATASGVFVFMARLHFCPKPLMLRDLSHPAASNFWKKLWRPLSAGSQLRSTLCGKFIERKTCSAVARFTRSPLTNILSKILTTAFFSPTWSQNKGTKSFRLNMQMWLSGSLCDRKVRIASRIGKSLCATCSVTVQLAKILMHPSASKKPLI